MEKKFKEKYKVEYADRKAHHPKVSLVKYADDFIVTADKKETLVEIKEM